MSWLRDLFFGLPEEPRQIEVIIVDNIGPPVSSYDWEYFDNNRDYILTGVIVGNGIEYRQYRVDYTRWGASPPG